jgi:cytochrome P450
VSRLSSLGETYDPSSVEGIHLLKFSDVGSDHTPYLEAVVAECLRCAGVGVAAERDALEDTVVLGHAIPKGVTVLCYASQVGNWNNAEKQKKGWTIASDSPVRSATSRAAALKGVWDDECGIMDFKPERWLSYDSDGKVRYDANKGWNMQFGGGTRGCFGKNLAVSVVFSLSLVFGLLA